VVATVAYDVRTWSAAPPERVFALVADANTWSQWAGPMIMRSWFGKEGSPPPGGVGAVLKLVVGSMAKRLARYAGTHGGPDREDS
jgi:uncharacterized protein YndB with AHSA1/START domain